MCPPVVGKYMLAEHPHTVLSTIHYPNQVRIYILVLFCLSFLFYLFIIFVLIYFICTYLFYLFILILFVLFYLLFDNFYSHELLF